MKKIFSAVICAALVLSLAGCDNQNSVENTKSRDKDKSSSEGVSKPVSSDSDIVYDFSKGDFEYEDTEGGIRITKYLGKGGYVKIPDKIDGKTIVEIKSDSFDGCVGLVSILIPAKLTKININGRPVGCTNLESIEVADDNPSYYSFDGVLYEKKKDGLWMMMCPVAKKGTVNIPDIVTQIGEYVFKGCERIESINIPKSVTDIGSIFGVVQSTFEECNSLVSINVAEDNPNYCSFDGILCKKWSDGEVTAEVCPKAKGGEIVIPDGVTVVGDIFYENSNITSVFIGSDVKEISRGRSPIAGFIGNDIPKKVSYIARFECFDGCVNLKSLRVSENNPTYFCSDGMFCEKRDDGEIELRVCLPFAKNKIVIPDSVTFVGSCAFENSKEITSVTIPSGVNTIGTSAFSGCSKLESVDISESVSVIGESAFKGCENLSSVIIPNSVTYIGSSVFYGCPSITVTYKGKTYTQGNMDDLYKAVNGR